MKKSTIIASLSSLGCAFMLLFAPSAFAQISPEQAKNIALQHAKVNQNEAGFIQVKQDFDDGIPEYEIEFYKGNTEYEYTINANNGQIISNKQELKQGFFDQASQAMTNSNQATFSITNDQAIETALKHAQLNKSQVRNLACYQDIDDGRSMYKVKFWKEYTEYEYEIDANNGQIIEFDIEQN